MMTRGVNLALSLSWKSSLISFFATSWVFGVTGSDIFELQGLVDRSKKSYEEALSVYNLLKSRIDETTRADNVPAICQGRLTPTASTPVTAATATNQANIRFSPYLGDKISLYRRSAWRITKFTETTLALSGTSANTNYDVFAYNNNGTLALELSAAWASTTARTDALALQDGVWVKGSDTTRRYLGTVRINGTADRYDDNGGARSVGLWNYYNRVPRYCQRADASNNWTYNANAWRIAGADANNFCSFIIGMPEALVRVRIKSNIVSTAAGNRSGTMGIGLDSTTANSALLLGGRGNGSGSQQVQIWAEYQGFPGIGWHTFNWIESVPAAANVRYWGDNASTSTASGILSEIEG